jgi:uncharacterized membrane protein YdjX (TVP38/TMEM64 family)
MSLLSALQEVTPPNVYSVWITFITVFGPIVGGAVMFWLNRKLGAIHTLVNGNLDAEKRANLKLRAKLAEHNIDPD